LSAFVKILFASRIMQKLLWRFSQIQQKVGTLNREESVKIFCGSPNHIVRVRVKVRLGLQLGGGAPVISREINPKMVNNNI